MKESATSRVARLLTMVPWLLAHPGVSIDEAAAEFGLTPAAVVTDLQLLFVCGLPGGMPDDLIEAEWETGRIYLGNADTIARPLRLSLEEALSLIVALRAIAGTGQLGDGHDVASTLAKLEEATAAHQRDELDAAGRRIHVQVADEDESEQLRSVRLALARRRRVHLDYLVPSRDELTHRDVDPMRVFAQDGHWYLEGFCHRASDVRLFRLDRVRQVTILEVDGTPPADAVARDLDAGLYQGAGSDTLVELELQPPAQWVADYYPHEDLSTGDGDSLADADDEARNGPTRIVLRVSDTAWVSRLLWRLRGHARVISPDPVAQEVVAGARAALRAYDTPR